MGRAERIGSLFEAVPLITANGFSEAASSPLVDPDTMRSKLFMHLSKGWFSFEISSVWQSVLYAHLQ